MTHTAEQVTQALMALVANKGNVAQTAKQLEMPRDMLQRWKTDTHLDEYRRLERVHGADLEDTAKELARSNMVRAAEIEAELLETLTPDKIAEPKDRAQALRAVADSRAKSTDKLLALTGRPTDGRAQAPDMGDVLRGLASKGLVKVNVDLELPEPAVDAEAVEEKPDS